MKQKTHKGTVKRMKKTKGGKGSKILRSRVGLGHLMSKKGKGAKHRRKRNKTMLVTKADQKRKFENLLP